MTRSVLFYASCMVCLGALAAGCATTPGSRSALSSVVEGADESVGSVGSIAGRAAAAPGNLVDKAFVTFPAAAVKTIVDKDNYGKTVYLDQPTTPGSIEPRQRPASERPYRPLSLFEDGGTAPLSPPQADEDVCGVEAEG